MSFYFLIFCPLIILSSILIIASKNAITSVLYLICIFLLSALCLLLLGAEFLSVLLIIVYVGAISILFLFVIMMLNLRIVEVYNSLVSFFPIGCFLGFFFFFFFFFFIKFFFFFFFFFCFFGFFFFSFIFFLIKYDFDLLSLSYTSNNLLDLSVMSNSLLYSSSNLYLIGDILYNGYSYMLIYAGLLLLLAMIGSMVLTVDSNYHNIKYKKVKNYMYTRELKNRISFWSIPTSKSNKKK